MNPADLAVVAMAVVALASIARDYLLQAKTSDRMRIVPPKSPPADKGDQK